MASINNFKRQIEIHMERLQAAIEKENYPVAAEEAAAISKLAYALKMVEESNENKRVAVKKMVLGWLDSQNTYDGTLLKCIDYCFDPDED